jgi:uncharacterized membrane protein (UPF0127 family)
MAIAKQFLKIQNIDQPLAIPLTVKKCQSFFCKFCGLMLRNQLNMNEGILFINSNNSRINSSIHTLLMKFDIAVFWIDSNHRVVDKTIARKWKWYYFPKKSATYILETSLENISLFRVGDLLEIKASD